MAGDVDTTLMGDETQHNETSSDQVGGDDAVSQ